MTELKKVIKALLESVHPRVFSEDSNDQAAFPYVVFNLPTSNNIDPREDFSLDIDIWDNNKDSNPIEDLTQSIDELLNRQHSINEKVLVNFYRINRLVIKDDNQAIKHRRLIYQAKTYFL